MCPLLRTPEALARLFSEAITLFLFRLHPRGKYSIRCAPAYLSAKAVSPEVCHPLAERAVAREAARTAGAARAELPPGNSARADGSVGSGWVSLVGAAESAVAAMAAVDPQTLSLAAGDGAAAFADQRSADGPPTESAEDAAAAEHLWAHQAGLSAQAPHSGEDRPLGCAPAGLHGSRSGFALRQFASRRVHATPAPSIPLAHHLDGIAGGAGARRRGRTTGLKRDRRGAALCAAGRGFRQRQRVPQLASEALVEQRQIQMTRGRPYKKDDNAHVEQKNWTHVRKLLGWDPTTRTKRLPLSTSFTATSCACG